jgi:hypothetical protein
LSTTFRKLGPFPSSGEWRKAPTLLWPNRVGAFLPSPEDESRSRFRKVVFWCFNLGRWTESETTAILSATHHRKNPSDPMGHLSHLESYFRSRSQQTATVQYSHNCVFRAGAKENICDYSGDVCSCNILFLTLLSVKECAYIEVKQQICGDSLCETVNSR